MNTNIYNIFKFSAALSSALLLLFFDALPKRELSLFKDDRFAKAIYSETQSEGKSSIEWLNSTKTQWRCQHEPHSTINCGFSLASLDMLNTVDLSSHSGLLIKGAIKTDASHLRFFVRNYNLKYFSDDDWNSALFMSSIIRTNEFDKGEIFIDFNNLYIPEWWAINYKLERKDYHPHLNRIQSVGFDLMQPGTTDLLIEDIVAIGDIISKTTLYLGLLTFWLSILLIESGKYAYRALAQFHAHRLALKTLAENNKQLNKERDRLIQKVTQDSLTGILNREGFQSRAKEIFADKTQEHAPSLMILDIDLFKKVNDTYGHATGDRILVEFSQAIQTRIRNSDALARWGGEEFVLLCPNIPTEQLERVADNIRASIEGNVFVEDESPLTVTASIGVAQRKSHENFEALFERADAALYDAKKSGRNCVKLAK